MKRRINTLIPFILVMLIGLFLTNFYEIKKSNILLAAFNKYSCSTIQGNISTVATLDIPLASYDDMQKEAELVLTKLNIKNTVQIDKNENDEKISYVVTRGAEDSDTIVKIESTKDETGKISKTYLMVNTILYNKIDGLGYVQTMLNDLHETLKLDYNMNITVVGRFDGNMDKSEQIKLADKVFKSIKAKKIDSFETEDIYSAYGYTGYIKDFIIQNKKKVNVNLAMRYNNYEDKTYLYIATPIITTEY